MSRDVRLYCPFCEKFYPAIYMLLTHIRTVHRDFWRWYEDNKGLRICLTRQYGKDKYFKIRVAAESWLTHKYLKGVVFG